MVIWINSVGKYSGEKEISRLGKWKFAQMQDMALSEVISREVTWITKLSSVGNRVEFILVFSPSEGSCTAFTMSTILDLGYYSSMVVEVDLI